VATIASGMRDAAQRVEAVSAVTGDVSGWRALTQNVAPTAAAHDGRYRRAPAERAADPQQWRRARSTSSGQRTRTTWPTSRTRPTPTWKSPTSSRARCGTVAGSFSALLVFAHSPVLAVWIAASGRHPCGPRRRGDRPRSHCRGGCRTAGHVGHAGVRTQGHPDARTGGFSPPTSLFHGRSAYGHAARRATGKD